MERFKMCILSDAGGVEILSFFFIDHSIKRGIEQEVELKVENSVTISSQSRRKRGVNCFMMSCSVWKWTNLGILDGGRSKSHFMTIH